MHVVGSPSLHAGMPFAFVYVVIRVIFFVVNVCNKKIV